LFNYKAKNRGSILLWVLVFNTLLVSTFFYFSLQVKNNFQQQKTTIDFLEKKESLTRLMNSVSQNNFNGNLVRGDYGLEISRYIETIQGELFGNNVQIYSFSETDKEITNNFDGLENFVLKWNKCDIDTGGDEKGSILISLFSWPKNLIGSYIFRQKELKPGGVDCVASIWRDQQTSLITYLDGGLTFDPQNNNYFLFLGSLDTPLHYQLEGEGATEKIPDNYLYIQGKAILDNGHNIRLTDKKNIALSLAEVSDLILQISTHLGSPLNLPTLYNQNW